ncbi:SDR family NAD(P)-dependent oxidoreductase [uncultured Bacteroides sp.]|uniref:SDR family NAD(P)-dependent oxidoreductase n=1 Tax=uncultured Bacteroides sp. TaxID=162156 RepID=UPI002616C325|nr:SDR family NAD(P)-dependent oxidoreductase [uncultured Bacteroides sp.]
MKKTAVITGADGGMGTEITKAVAAAGYHVIMLCYTSFRGEERRSQISLETGNKDIKVMQVDLSSMENVADVAHRILEQEESIDLLMNNAGTMCTQFTQTHEDFEYTVAVNYLSHFLLTHLLLLKMHRGTRIVSMVSCTYAVGKIGPNFFTKGREGSFWRIPIYSNTKLALWLFTCKMAEVLKEKGITVNAADPGIVSTNIIRMDMWFDPLTDVLFRPFIRKPRTGADTAIRLLLEPGLEGVTGQMFASGKPKKLKEKYLHHPQMESLYADTEKLLGKYLKKETQKRAYNN